MSVRLLLTDEERLHAIQEGHRRTRYAIAHRLVTRFDDPDKDPRGCIGEKAACKLFSLPWRPVLGTDKERGDLVLPDGQRVEVRAARYPYDMGLWDEVFTHDAHKQKLYLFCQANLDCNTVIFLGWYEGALIPNRFAWSEDVGRKLRYPSWIIIRRHLRLMPDFPHNTEPQLSLF